MARLPGYGLHPPVNVPVIRRQLLSGFHAILEIYTQGLVVRNGDTAFLLLSLAGLGSTSLRALLFVFFSVGYRRFGGATEGSV